LIRDLEEASKQLDHETVKRIESRLATEQKYYQQQLTTAQARIKELEREGDELARWQSTAESHAAIEQAGVVRLPGEGWLSAIRRLTADDLVKVREERDEARAELERWASVSSERNHGASGLCCLLRDAEREKAATAQARIEELTAENERLRPLVQCCSREHDFDGNCDRHPQGLQARVGELERELADYKAAAPLCEQHKPDGGHRSGCLVCELIEYNYALSRIDYRCGDPNELEVSSYDVHATPESVVIAVGRLLQRATSAR
jgi:hypothetical protein